MSKHCQSTLQITAALEVEEMYFTNKKLSEIKLLNPVSLKLKSLQV